jgi:uncharacterized protein (DUF849 family)
MTDRIWRIMACLNGRRNPADHPGVPVSPAQLAAAAASAVTAGAEAVHVHPRGADGRESLRAVDVGAAVAAVRAACPHTPVGVTTGLWVTADRRSRQHEVAAWATLDAARRPDFASVNIGEEGSLEVAAALTDAGIGAEAGIWSVADAVAFTESMQAGRWLRIMVEVMDVTAVNAAAKADEILNELQAAEVGIPVLLHGENAGCWPLVAHAGRLGLATRIGLEDVLSRPDGGPVADNAELVRLAIGEWEAAR